ncbi:uncharacterized protein LOC106051732 [Biomphalaria glabrata]|uniref:Uncharacterized protein LOC106051732 n=1 Tax=Biomphalaria glabrata TaxID=6526 RepID=A0A9W2YY81_BIOGL|nr:uncharacterized protein LOC106051732 [Biomphalaria glabrata]XP_055867673.1 uncharacterized protein LOC106051732 [Biomphalaria glabrata]
MPSMGLMTTLSLVESGLALMLWVVAFSTRGWSVWSAGPIDVSIGLFTFDAAGTVGDNPTSENPFLTTIALETIGGVLMFAAVGLLAMSVFKKNKLSSVVFMCAAFLSGIFIFAAIGYYRVNSSATINNQKVTGLSIGYSWYLAMISGVLILSAPGALFAAMRRGEISFGGY